MKAFFYFILSTLLVVSFQNCGNSNQQNKDLPTERQGNGDPYSGIQAKAGNYYVFEENYRCANSQLTPAGRHYQFKLEIKENDPVATKTDSCTGQVESVSLNSVFASVNQEDVVLVDGTLYQRFDGDDRVDHPEFIVVAQCFSSEALKFDIGIEYLVLQRVNVRSEFLIERISSREKTFETAVTTLNEIDGSSLFSNLDFTLSIAARGDTERRRGLAEGTIGSIKVSESLSCTF